MAAQEDPSSISRFRWLIVCFANEITNRELKQAKSLVRDRLGARNNENIKDTFDFFDKLQEGNYFHEGDTLLLRHILNDIGRNDLIEELNKYNSEYAVIARHYGKHPAASEGPFIGRKDRLDELFHRLNKKYEDGVATICISGLPGMGKTRLAKEACYRQIEYHELLFVDLRELSTTESIYSAVMYTMGEDTSNVDINVLILRLKKYKPKKAGGVVLLFANADRPLRTPKKGVNDDVYNNFVELIERIVVCRNDCLKLLITTRMGLPRQLCARYEKCVFPISIRAEELDYDEARGILQYYAGRTVISDEEAERLIHLCGKCPLALKVTASRLQDQIIPPKKLIEYLDNESDDVTNLGFYGDVKLEACLKNAFDSLPDKQKVRMIRLASIPGTFTGRAALAVFGMKRNEQVEVNLQLQDLKYRNLIETSIDDNEDFSKSDVRYRMHLLIRQFLQRIAQIDASITLHYELGEQEFVGYFLRKLKKIGTMSEKRYKKAMKRKNEDATNFQELLRLLPKQKRDIEAEEWRVISSTVELFYSTKERLKFFKAQRELEHQNQSTLEFVEMSAYEGLQMSRINYHYEEILPLFENAEQMLLKTTKIEEIRPDKRSLGLTRIFKREPEEYFAEKYIESLNFAEKEKLITLYQLWGNVCTTCVQDLEQADERIRIAYALVKKLKLRNTNTARFYSTMADVILNKSRLQRSNALCEKSKIKEAMEFYKMAYELRKDLTGSENHPQIPVFLANIGSCYYQLEEEDDAIMYYKWSLRVEDEQLINNEEGYLKTLRNMALAYRDKERYEDAIDFGERCANRRLELLGNHTDTSRIYYLLGLFYLERNSRGDLKAAEQNFEEALKIEEQLWMLGKPHSVDWDNLKRRILIVLAKTNQKIKYQAYKLRFERAERKSSQRPSETVITDADAESDSSDESIEGDTPMQNLEETDKSIPKRYRKRQGSTSSSDEDGASSLVSKYSGISSMASIKDWSFVNERFRPLNLEVGCSNPTPSIPLVYLGNTLYLPLFLSTQEHILVPAILSTAAEGKDRPSTSSRASALTSTAAEGEDALSTSARTSVLTSADFQAMLIQVSSWYDHHKSIGRLKVLYKDLVKTDSDLLKSTLTMDLFKLLQSAGHLKPTNLKVLIDTVKVTGTHGVVDLNEVLCDANDETSITAFSTHRQKLIQLGNVLLADDIIKLGDLYEVERDLYNDQWTLILKLEMTGAIREDKMSPFIEDLKKIGLHQAARKLEQWRTDKTIDNVQSRSPAKKRHSTTQNLEFCNKKQKSDSGF